MPQRLQIISENSQALKLVEALQNAGYSIILSKSLTRLSSTEPKPALCLLDLALSSCSPSNELQEWTSDCQSIHTACLGLDFSGESSLESLAGLEPLVDIIRAPFDTDQLSSKIRSLLTLSKLNRQLEAARHQMSRYQEELQDALQSAAHIQRSLIPKKVPNYNNLHFAWNYMPCKQVGGDLFNIVQLDENNVMVYLVDVSGHGISSAMVTVSVHQSLSIHTGQLVKRPTEHAPYYSITPPAKVLHELETEYPFERFEEFFTITYMLINTQSGQIRYSNAGHPPSFLLRTNGDIERLEAGGTIIGIGELIEFEEGETTMTPGDRLFLYTDGITEHCNTRGEPYGEQRFLQSLIGGPQRPLDEGIRDAMIAMRTFGGSLLPVDDVTLLGAELKT